MQIKLKRATTVAALAAVLSIPHQSHSDPPPQNDWVIAAAVVVAAGVAVTGIYLVARASQPKYYWLMDDTEHPPRFWVGTATVKECEINSWHRIGGPYNRPQDAPPEHPDPTNRVNTAVSAPLNITVESSLNGGGWQPVYQTTSSLEDFAYFPTNTSSGSAMFRLLIKP